METALAHRTLETCLPKTWCPHSRAKWRAPPSPHCLPVRGALEIPGEWRCQPSGVLSERVGTSQLDLGLEKSHRRKSLVEVGGPPVWQGSDKPVCPVALESGWLPASWLPCPSDGVREAMENLGRFRQGSLAAVGTRSDEPYWGRHCALG